MSSTNGGTKTITVEASLHPALAALSNGERAKCLKAIDWFEGEGRPRHKTARVPGTDRRRLRSVHVSKALCVVFAESNEGCNWVWGGRFADLDVMASKLDAAVGGDVERVELAPDSFAPGDADARNGEFADDFTRLLDLASEIEAEVAATREAHAAIGRRTKALLEEADAKVAAARAAAEEKAADDDEAGFVETSRFKTLLARYNELRAESERTSLELKRTTRRLEMAQADLVARSEDAKEAKAARQRADVVAKELAAIKGADRKVALAAITEQAISSIKDKCAKVLDDQANLYLATERSDLVREARTLGELAMRIRALRIETPAP